MKTNKILIFSVILGLMLSATGLIFTNVLAAASDPGLGAAANASILSTTELTNSGSSSTSRDVYVSPLSEPQPAGLLVGGAYHSADGDAAGVLSAASAASLNLAGQPLTSNQGPALDGLTLTTGVYDIGAGRLNGGVLTLDGPGVYVFRADSDFISSGSISFINGASACDLYWRVETLATINGSSFAGTIIAGTGVHFGDSVTLNGRALAINGDVTLINDTITGPNCTAAPATGGGLPDNPQPESGSTEAFIGTATAAALRAGVPSTGGAPLQGDGSGWLLAGTIGFVIVALFFALRKIRQIFGSK